jgi:prolipoprotein diacylglyceryltransferase
MSKQQVINFRDFMDGSYKLKKKSVKVTLFSALPVSTIFSPSSMFNPPEPIAQAYGLIFIVGGVLIGAAILEHLLVMGRKQGLAKDISGYVKIALPWVLLGGLILFVLTNPLI